MRTALQLALTALLAGLLTGCNFLGFSDSSTGDTPLHPPEINVTFAPESITYDTDDDVELVLRNGTDRMVFYNLCFSTLQRRTNETWSDADHSGFVCTAELRGLPPGETVQFSYSLSHFEETPEPGTYRLETDIFVQNDSGEEQEFVLRTRAFELVAP